ncbi:hypothetical protein [Streptomyces echinatus]|uniref:Uncharacterized protein n=1 Tax=Streptomyces echinatus TaxID=67293 RepID=A0A7W9Q4D6_9ACTN|nr:hypothetical protein [Streptomyces echinatus]MBB5932592.1 hypothetical protein [Streptomyces echinatus]
MAWWVGGVPAAPTGECDPAKLAEQAATERDAALAEARQLRVELAAHQAAPNAGAEPARLLDSRTADTAPGWAPRRTGNS